MSFSERYGYKPVREKIQLESMDDTLRNHLWTILHITYWDPFKPPNHTYDRLDYKDNRQLFEICARIWVYHLGLPLDEMPNNWTSLLKMLKKAYNQYKWFEAYDFIEFISQNFSDEETNIAFRKRCNEVLEKELSAYRFVDKQISRITNKEEIESIDAAIDESNDQVGPHLARALELLSDRKSPDYRNSIKESISAVESLVQKVVGQKGTLGQLIEKVEEHFEIHPALKESFKKLYGYTSDEDGIRHAMLEESKLDFDDAKFILVTCSAFINYVRGKLETS